MNIFSTTFYAKRNYLDSKFNVVMKLLIKIEKGGYNAHSEINDYVNQPIVIYWGHMAT